QPRIGHRQQLEFRFGHNRASAVRSLGLAKTKKGLAALDNSLNRSLLLPVGNHRSTAATAKGGITLIRRALCQSGEPSRPHRVNAKYHRGHHEEPSSRRCLWPVISAC